MPLCGDCCRSTLYEKQQGDGTLRHQYLVYRISHRTIQVRLTVQTTFKDVSDGLSSPIIVSQVAGQCMGIAL
jgi:hypothetical protein